MSVAYDELRRLVEAGAATPSPENLDALGITSEDLDRYSVWDGRDTFERVLPMLTGVPAEVMRTATHIALPPEHLIGLVATHTASGILLGLSLAKARRG